MDFPKSLIEQLIRERANKALPSSHDINQRFMEELSRNLETGLGLFLNPTAESTPNTDPEQEERDYKHAVLKAAQVRRKHRLSLDLAYQKELKSLEVLQADIPLFKRKLPKLNNSSIDARVVSGKTADFTRDLRAEAQKLQELHGQSQVLSIAKEIHAKLVDELEALDDVRAA